MKKGLGKGLNALLPSIAGNGEQQAAVVDLEIGKIEPNTEQPRKHFDEEALRQLADSIAAVGVVQPIIVTDEGSYYRIVAGERRWRASRLAGRKTVPAIIRSFSKEQSMEVALIENLQRQDLNPIEEALGYERLMSDFGYTQEKLAQAVGRSRPAIANAVRLLRLPERLRDLTARGKLSPGHARALLSVEDRAQRDALADEIIERELSVRQTELLVSGEGDLRHEIAAAGTRGAAAGGGSTAGAGGVARVGTGAAADGAARGGGSTGGAARGAAGSEGAARGAAGSEGAARAGGAVGPADGALGYGSGAYGSGARAFGAAGPEGAEGRGAVVGGAGSPAHAAVLKQLEDTLRSHFNTNVALTSAARGKGGRIVIEYYGEEELQRILEQFGIPPL
ncbi:MAG: ParB/RepB/Spo0J family partition protein [Clostridiales bacterium]|nr:ParB/RepB/Spo0J family partition protein [Clostridiales bacterium]